MSYSLSIRQAGTGIASVFDELTMLQELGLSKFLDPSSLVDQVIDQRNNPKRGIEAPWSGQSKPL